MKGIWLENKNVSLKNDLPIPTPGNKEVLIKVLIAGICNTDIELIKGYYPYTGVLGHEFVGVVEDGCTDLIGKRVVGEINLTCGKCINCLTGLKNHCYDRSVFGIINKNGAFSEYVTLPIENIYEVPQEVTIEEASFTEPLAAAIEIQQQIQMLPTDKILIIGDGKLGILIAQVLLLKGCELWMVGHHQKKYKLVEPYGAIVGTEDIVKPHHFDIVVECTGNPNGFNLALKALRPRGTLVMKSTYAGMLQTNAALIVVNELTVIGSRCGPFQPALNLLKRKLVDVKCLIEKKYHLHEGLLALEHAKKSGAMKILLDNCI